MTTSSTSKGDILVQLVNDAAKDNVAIAAGYWPGVSGEAPTIHVVGLADRATNTALVPTDRMRVGSITKSVTVTVLLQLYEEGLLSLDDEIQEYYPEIQNGNATLAQLADMTSGICNYLEDLEFTIELFTDLTRVWTFDDLLNRCPPYGTPGELWRYSNTNTVLLGGVIEQVTGQLLGEVMKSRIFDPLGMSDTVYPTTAEFPASPTLDGFAQGYLGPIDEATGMVRLGDTILISPNATLVSPTASRGSGALTSSLEDMRVWVTALVNGTLVSPATHALQMSTLVPTLDEPHSPVYDAYGLGIGSLGNNSWLGHTGDFIGYQALAMSDPEDLSVVVILTNYKDLANGKHVPEDIFEAWIAETTRSPNSNESIAAPPTMMPTIEVSSARTITQNVAIILVLRAILYWSC